jgi:hypothetical protein
MIETIVSASRAKAPLLGEIDEPGKLSRDESLATLRLDAQISQASPSPRSRAAQIVVSYCSRPCPSLAA